MALAVVSPPANEAPPLKGPRTLQQDFDDASSDAAAGKCQNAIPKFEALERNAKIKPGSIPAAAIAVRKGICLARLNKAEADEVSMQTALSTLAKAGNSFDIDVADGWSALGDASYRRYDYAGAVDAYKRALAVTKGEYRLIILTKLAKATTFDGDAASLSYAEEGLKILSSMPKPNKDSLATFHTLYARTLLNQGIVKPAYKELKTALALSGGLTIKTTLSEVSLRSDLAMAAMLAGEKSEARRYLAYTGAGRIEKSPFKAAEFMDPPLCGDETGLRPDDVAVVEFSITEDGTVASAQTVYSRGGPQVAAAFGRAVSDWYWKPEDLQAIPAFYRMLTRVELRCSNLLAAGLGVMGPLRERFHAWATSRIPAVGLSDITNSRLREILHQHADDTAGSADATVRIAALGWLAQIEPASGPQRVAMADEAMSLAGRVHVPQEVIHYLRIVRQIASLAGQKESVSKSLSALMALANDSAIANDALAANTLRLMAARGRLATKLKEAPALLNAVAQDERLPSHHPLRQLAWLDLAGRAASDGNRAEAQKYFSRTGLTEEQCALLGEAPTLKRTNVNSNDYPNEALMMGFEGWVRTEHDIMTDGKTANVRPIIAYPPMIFVDAAKGMTTDLQYDVSFRPGSSLACNANRQTFNFIIP